MPSQPNEAHVRSLFKPVAWVRTLLSPAMQAVVLVVLSAFFFSIMNVTIRIVTQGDIPVLEVVAFRNLFGWMVLWPWWLRVGRYAFQSPAPRFYAFRSSIGMLGMILMFWSVKLLHPAEAVALNFTLPLFAVIGAYFFLGEKVGARRWGATAVGFIGVLIMLQPGAGTFKLAAIVPIAAAAAMAAAILSVKHLTRLGEDPVRAVFLNGMIATPLTFAMAATVWVMPSWSQLAILFLIGIMGTLAHITFTMAFKLADASYLIGFDYLRLPFVAILSYFWLGEVPTVWIWPGAGLIALSSIYIAQRERKRALEAMAKDPQSQPAKPVAKSHETKDAF